ncbi:MAG TPA: ATP-binding protein [Candidatus Paceibacterota bacterium]
MNKSKWYVITGVPSSGKTTVLEHLARAGYQTVPEAARVLIDEGMAQRKTIAEIRSNEGDFQRRVVKLKLKTEADLPLEEVVFLDRAMPDSIAYYQLCGLDPQEARVVCHRDLYRKVFLMEPIAFEGDYSRIESPEAIAQLNNLLRDAYEQLGYEVTVVPAVSVEDRVRFIQERV